MLVENRQVAAAWTRVQARKHEFMGARNFREREVLRRRAEKNKVVVLRVIERKQTAALHAQLAAEQAKYLVQAVYREHFPYAGVMVSDLIRGIAPRVVIAHPGLGTPDKSGIAENHPWFLRSRSKGLPERLKCRR